MSKPNLAITSVFVFSLQGACAPPSQSADAPAPPAPKRASDAATADVSTSSVPAASGSPTHPPSPVEPSPFHIVGIGGEFIPVEETLYLYDGDLLIAEVVGDQAVNHPEYLGSYGSTGWGGPTYLGGKWPNGFIGVTRPAERSHFQVVFKHVGNAWRQVHTTEPARWVQSMKPYGKGRQLGLVLEMGDCYYWLVELNGGHPAPRPQPAKVDECRGQTAVLGRDLDTLPTGHVYVVGPATRSYDAPTWWSERWKPGARNSTVERLPLPEGELGEMEVSGVRAITESEVYAFGSFRLASDAEKSKRAYLARFDGTSWSLLPSPGAFAIRSLAKGEDAVWFVGGDDLYTLHADGSVTQILLPTLDAETRASFDAADQSPTANWRLSAYQVFALGTDIWVNARLVQGIRGYGPFVLRTRPFATVWRGLGEGQDYDQTMARELAPRPADQDCKSVFVQLYAVTSATPQDYDYPQTRQALIGQEDFADFEFAEVELAGKRSFGAFVSSVYYADLLVKRIRETVKGSAPIALCTTPKRLRVLEFDRQTGDVTKNERVQD